MRKYLKGLKRIMCLGLVGVMMFMMVPSDFGGSIEARAAGTVGELSITLPTDSNYTYGVEVQTKKYNGSGEEVAHGIGTCSDITFSVNDSVPSNLATDWKGILSIDTVHSANDKLKIGNIPIDDEWYTGYTVQVVVTIMISDASKEVQIDGQTSKTLFLIEDGTVAIDSSDTSIIENQHRLTTEDFTSIANANTGVTLTYDYFDLINNFGIIALDEDIEGQHIVGPIIAKTYAYKTIERTTGMPQPRTEDELKSLNQVLEASDYSRGTFSYIGKMFYSNNTPNKTLVQFSHKFDLDHGVLGKSYKAPAMFTMAKDIVIVTENINNEDTDYIVVADGTKFLSSNVLGKTTESKELSTIYKSDAFIDWERLKAAATDKSDEFTMVSDKIVVDSSMIVSGVLNGDSYQGVLTIEAGKSYNITSDSIDAVNIIMPEEYDFFYNPYPEQTLVNFLGDSFYSQTIADETHYVFPRIYVNGKPLVKTLNPPLADDGEFGERGNKLIWNFPDLATVGDSGRMRLQAQDIPGHILAPNVEIWNYNNATTWEGGNLNGSAIVKSFHGGTMEIHLFPYDGGSEIGVIIKAEKTVDDKSGAEVGLAGGEYSFKLDASQEVKDAILNGNIYYLKDGNDISSIEVKKPELPLIVDVKADGSIEFPALCFSKAGSYDFIINEVTDGTPIDGVIYDQSQFKVTVVVDKQPDGTFTSSCAIVRIKDATGNSAATPEDSIIFNNTTGTTYGTTFTKKDADDDSLALKGAEFTVTECDEHGNITAGAVSKTVTSNEQGTVNITGLKADKSYKVVETEAPEGYSKTDDYYIISVDTNGVITVKLNGSGANIDNWVVTNTKAEYTLPLTGGNGTLAFYLVGTSCIGLALIMGMRRKYTNEKI